MNFSGSISSMVGSGGGNTLTTAITNTSPPTNNPILEYVKKDPKAGQEDICWRFDEWLMGMGGLSAHNVLDYFSMSPFYDRNCINEILKMQRATDFDAKLRDMTGVAYYLQAVFEPHLFIILKQYQIKKPQALPSKPIATPLALYYIIDGTVYQAHNISSIVKAKMVNSLHRVNSVFHDIQKFVKHTPTRGYHWDFQQQQQQQKSASAATTTTDKASEAGKTAAEVTAATAAGKKEDAAAATAAAKAKKKRKKELKKRKMAQAAMYIQQRVPSTQTSNHIDKMIYDLNVETAEMIAAKTQQQQQQQATATTAATVAQPAQQNIKKRERDESSAAHIPTPMTSTATPPPPDAKKQRMAQ